MAEHTKGEWEVVKKRTEVRIYPPDNNMGKACGIPKHICTMASWDTVNAERICHCVNMHDELVEAMETMTGLLLIIESNRELTVAERDMLIKAEAVLKKANHPSNYKEI